MTLHVQLLRLVVAALLAVGLSVGCGRPDAPPAPETGRQAGSDLDSDSVVHDPHDVPLTQAEIEQLRQETATYPDAVERIAAFRDTIRNESTGSEPARAHRALDQLDLVLQWLPAIARDSGVPRGDWEEINVTARRLRELFDQVHEEIDAGRTPDYEAVAQEIEDGIQRLEAVQAEDTTAAEQTDRDSEPQDRETER